jgi:hypothetical protein
MSVQQPSVAGTPTPSSGVNTASLRVSFGAFLQSPEFGETVFENWESEFLAPSSGSFRLPLDLFDGTAGVVAFKMTNVAPPGVPSLPCISEFPQLNVRT